MMTHQKHDAVCFCSKQLHQASQFILSANEKTIDVSFLCAREHISLFFSFLIYLISQHQPFQSGYCQSPQLHILFILASL